MVPFLKLTVAALVILALPYVVNAVLMYGTFIRESPLVSASAIYGERFIRLYVQREGIAHGVTVVQLAMQKAQALACGASPPDGFQVVRKPPLAPDRVTFCPLRPTREIYEPLFIYLGQDGDDWVVWSGAFRVRTGPPVVLPIPCQRSLNEPVTVALRYQYHVGLLMAEEGIVV